MPEHKRKPNRLMQGMIIVSLAVHLVLFMHIAGIYRSETLTCIELSMRDISKPPGRSIPRPRVRHKPPETHEAKKLTVQKQRVPNIKIDPVKNDFAESLMENVATPDVPETPGLDVSEWSPDTTSSEFVTSNDYFDMLRLKIESRKKYPDVARLRHREGGVRVKFVITPDGGVTSLKIVKSARFESLNQAALNAVKDAAPFPRPPANLFSGNLTIEVTIMFELT